MTLPPRTQQVHAALLALADEQGIFVLSLEEVAHAVGVSRQVLHRHMHRLRAAKLLEDLDAMAGKDAGWRRVRRVRGANRGGFVTTTEQVPRLQTPVTNPSLNVCPGYKPPVTNPYIYIYENMHAVDTGELRSPVSTAGRSRADREGDAAVENEIDDATLEQQLIELMSGPSDPPRPFEWRLLPPYPDTKRVLPVYVPKMPRLSDDNAANAKLLVRAYKAACLKHYGKRPRVDGKATFRMRHAERALRRHKFLSPYAWASFRMRQWQYSERRTKPPSIDYVFSVNVIDEHAEHFKARSDSYDVLRKIVLTPAHSALITRWERARRAVASPKAGPPGEDETMRIIDQHLPAAVYHDLADLAAAQRSDMLADLHRRLAAGEWIW